MAGHSHWAGIKHKKGRADRERSKIFSKLSREITVAAKLGDNDPNMNPRLRAAIQAAKEANMPKDMKKPKGEEDTQETPELELALAWLAAKGDKTKAKSKTGPKKKNNTVKNPNEKNIEEKPVIVENNGAPVQSNAKVGKKS